MKNLYQLKTILVILFFLGATAWSADYVIIVNPANGASKVSKAELKRIFKGKRKPWGGEK